MRAMETIVFRLDDLARQRVSRVQRLEQALMFVTLFVLLIEALFIFVRSSSDCDPRCRVWFGRGTPSPVPKPNNRRPWKRSRTDSPG